MWKLLLLIAVMFTTNICNAHVQVSTTQLNNTKWELVKRKVFGKEEKSTDAYHTVAFDMTTMNDSVLMSINGNPSGFHHQYYISDEDPVSTSFNFDNVGINSKGKYLVLYNNNVNRMYYYTIISFTSDELVLLRNAGDLLPDLYITYKRVNDK